MADANGSSPTLNVEQAERLVVLASAFVDRLSYARRLGLMYGGNRDVYEALGWKKHLTWDDLYSKYVRQDIAGRIIDLPPAATWRSGFMLTDDEQNPDEDTPFEAAWKSLDKRLHMTAAMGRLDRLAGIGEYAVMFFGLRGQTAVNPISRVRGPDDLLHVTVFPQPSADVQTLENDETSERFGLPTLYNLTVAERTTAGSGKDTTIGGGGSRSGRTVQSHWSRIVHCAESVDDTRLYGRPRLERVYNLLDSLQLVVGSTGEGYWRSAHPKIHADIRDTAAGQIDTSDLDRLAEEIAKMVHGFQDFMRTSHTDIQQLGASIADPSGSVGVMIDLLAAASEIPKRILLGSERGELASSQDAQEWAHHTTQRQLNHAEPVIVRPTVDLLIEAGVLPEPETGEYVVKWPDLTGPNAEQRVALAERMAKAEATHAQAEMLGHPVLTKNEYREALGFTPVDELDEAYPGERAEQQKEAEAEEQRQIEQEERLALPPPERQPTAPDDEDQDEEDDEEQRARAATAGPYVNNLPLITRAVGAIDLAPLRRQLHDPMLATIADIANVAARGFGEESADVATLAVREFMANFDRERLVLINSTTQQRVIETLLEGQLNQENRRQLATRVRRVFASMSRARAPVVALTETTRATTTGTLQGLLQSGVPSKTWRTRRDNRVREAHDLMEGQTVAIGASFQAPTGELAQGPGLFGVPALDIGCRCRTETLETPVDPAALAGLERRRAIHQRRVLAALRRALREQRDAVLAELGREQAPRVQYDEDQPRKPKGDPEGGQWTDEGGASTSVISDKIVPKDLKAVLKKFGAVQLYDDPDALTASRGQVPLGLAYYNNAAQNPDGSFGGVYNLRGDRTEWVLLHEWGHHIDYKRGAQDGSLWWSTTDNAMNALGADLGGLKDSRTYNALINSVVKKDREMQAVFADYVAAFTSNKAGYGHSTEYFSKPANRLREMFANAVAMRKSPTATAAAREVAPTWYSAFEQALELV
jgi:hypothetical protein